MKARFFINGWRESRNYFFNLGRFSEEEVAELKDGETICKNGNEFWVEFVEE